MSGQHETNIVRRITWAAALMVALTIVLLMLSAAALRAQSAPASRGDAETPCLAAVAPSLLQPRHERLVRNAENVEVGSAERKPIRVGKKLPFRMNAGRTEGVHDRGTVEVGRRNRRMRAQRRECFDEARAFDDRDLMQIDVARDELRQQRH